MSETQTAPIRPQRFWVNYKDKPNGEVVAEDWVEWVKRGVEHAPTTGDKVSRVMKDQTVWPVLAPFYKAWKEGQDAPVVGLPLDVLPFMTAETVQALGRLHIRSAEDLASMEDAHVQRAAIPGLRSLREKAATYIRLRQDQAPLANEMEQVRAELAALRAENKELADARDTLAAEAGKKRRSRDDVMSAAA